MAYKKKVSMNLVFLLAVLMMIYTSSESDSSESVESGSDSD